MIRGSNLRRLKEINKKNIFKLIYDNSPITRSKIAGKLKLSPTAISDLVEELILEKLIRESGQDISSGGRRPLLLEINPDCGYLAAIMIRKSSIIIALYDISLELIDLQEHKIDYFDISSIYARLISYVDNIRKEYQKQERKLLGIGLCLSPDVEVLEPRVVFSTSLNAESIPLSQALSYHFRVPVIKEKEIKIRAMAEYSKLNSIESMAYIKFDENIQSTIIANGDFASMPVNVEHIIIDRNGSWCEDGHRGCLKTIASTRAIIRKAMLLTLESKDFAILNEGPFTGSNLKDIYNPSILGESNLEIIGREVGDGIAICVVNLRNLLGIKRFSLAGEVVKLPGLLKWVKNSVKTLAEDVFVYMEAVENPSLLKQTASLSLKNIMEGQVI